MILWKDNLTREPAEIRAKGTTGEGAIVEVLSSPNNDTYLAAIFTDGRPYYLNRAGEPAWVGWDTVELAKDAAERFVDIHNL